MPGAEGSEATTGELLSTMATQLSELLRDEVRLAKAEIKQEATKAARAGAMLGGAAFAAYLGIVLLSFAAAWGLAVVIPTGFAFLLVGALYLGVRHLASPSPASLPFTLVCRLESYVGPGTTPGSSPPTPAAWDSGAPRGSCPSSVAIWRIWAAMPSGILNRPRS